MDVSVQGLLVTSRGQTRFHSLFWARVRTCPQHPCAWNVSLKPPLVPQRPNVN